MSYGHQGTYGYSPYFEQQEPQTSVSSHHGQSHDLGQQPASNSYHSQANSYSPYYQTTPINYIQNNNSQQDYAQRPTGDTPSYGSYQQNYQDSQPSYQQRSGARSPVYNSSQRYNPPERSRINDVSYDQTSRSYADTGGLGSLAYASTLNQSQSNTSYQHSEYRPVGSSNQSSEQQHENQHQSVAELSQPTSRGSILPQPYATPQHIKGSNENLHGRNLSNPSQYRVNYPSHTTAQAAGSKIYSSPQQTPVSTPTTLPASQQHSKNHRPQILSPPSRASNISPAGRRPAVKHNQKPETQHSLGQHQHKQLDMYTQPSHPESAMRSPLINTGFSPYETNENRPTTVDPSQIFDQAEYQRRKAAAETEAEAERVKAREKETSQLEQVAKSMINSAAPEKTTNTQSKHARTDSGTKEAIQAEMRSMIEKMRQYKSQDPVGFSEIWEQFKKNEPPPARASSQTPGTIKASLPPAGTPAAVTSPGIGNDVNVGGQIATSIEANVTPSAPGSDRGKFPAMRRRRKTDKGTPQTPAVEQIQHMPITKQTQETPVSHQAKQTSVVQQLPQTPMSQQIQQTPLSRVPKFPPSGTSWPEAQRREIADVVKRALEAHPANVGKFITASEIERYFLMEPSYDEFCQILMNKGFVLDKTSFARIILTVTSTPGPQPWNAQPSYPQTPYQTNPQFAQHYTDDFPLDPKLINTPQNMPNSVVSQNSSEKRKGRPRKNSNELSRPRRKPKKSTIDSPSEAKVTVHTTPSSFTPMINNSPNPVAPPANSLSTPQQLPSESQVNSELPQPRKLSVQTPLAETRPNDTNTPLTKEQMARKRDFRDLVDLTQQDESEEEESGQADVMDWQKSTTTQIQSQFGDQGKGAAGVGPTPESVEQRPKTTGPSLNAEQYMNPNEQPISQLESLRVQHVAKLLDYNKPLKKVKFNPLTIARDVLISRGEHPTEAELNWHLRPLHENFRHVNYRSDLSTIRWDLIDPGDPDPSEPIPKSESDEEAPLALKERSLSQDSKIIYRSPSPPMPTPQRESIMTRGSTRGRPRGKPRIYGSSGTTRADLAAAKPATSKKMPTTRDRLVSKEQTRNRVAPTDQPATSFTPINTPQKSSVMPKIVQDDLDTFMDSGDNSISGAKMILGQELKDQSPPSMPRVKSDFPGLAQGSIGPVLKGSMESLEKKRGRPSKSTLSSFRYNQSQGTSRDQSPSAPREQGVRKRGRPRGSKNRPSAKKPGRPAKTKESAIKSSMPVDGVGVMIPSRSPSITAPLSYIEIPPTPESKPKRWKARPTYPSETPDPDAFVSFACRWTGCSADLHNLETLGKHILRNHSDLSNKVITCQWESCGHPFFEQLDFQRHIQNGHLRNVAQKLGDGPSTHPPDGKGNLVTPFARTYGMPDPLPPNAGKGPTKSYHKAHGNITPEQKARAEERSRRFHEKMAADGGFPSPYKTNAPAVMVPTSVENSGESEDTDDSDSSVRLGGSSKVLYRAQIRVPVKGSMLSDIREGKREEDDEDSMSDDLEGDQASDEEASDSSEDPLAM